METSINAHLPLRALDDSVILRAPRPADDSPAIAAIYNPYVIGTTVSFETEPLSNEAMCRRIEAIAADHPYIVAESAADGAVAGYCYVHPWKERPAYAGTMETTIYLHPHWQHRGLGAAMMRQLINECRRRGYRALIACITADNEASIRFHKQLGFSKVSHFSAVGHKFGMLLDVVDCELLL